MVRYDNLGERLFSPENNVTSVLTLKNKILFEENSYQFASRYAWQFGHTATRSASNRSGGIASPSSFRVRRYASIASRMF
jgi:hypothetical protein